MNLGNIQPVPFPAPAPAPAPPAGTSAPAAPARLPDDEVRLSAPTASVPRPSRDGNGEPALSASLRLNGVENGSALPWQPALLQVRFTDPSTGAPVSEFDRLDEKHMHLVMVSEDLEHFAHVHPELRCDGTFELPLNQPLSDPDSQDAARAVPKAGRYLLFAHVKPRDREDQEARFELTAAGESRPVELLPDPVDPQAGIRKYFKANGAPGSFGDAYQVTLSVERMSHPGMDMLHLVANVRRARPVELGDRSTVAYEDVHDIEPWLGMPGHAILIGASGERVEDRAFRHAHAGHHGARTSPPTLIQASPGGIGPDLAFSLNGAEVPPPGRYKAWVQFKHEDRVLALPFVFDLAAGEGGRPTGPHPQGSRGPSDGLR